MKTAAEILESKLPLIFNHSTDAFKEAFLEAMEEYRSQPSDVSDEFKLQLVENILDNAEFIKMTQGGRNISLTEVVKIIKHFIVKEKRKIKPTISNTSNEWIDINFLLPETGVTVLCKLSKDIGLGTTEKKLYRMKYNGKWNDYDHLVTHWKIIGKNKVKVHYAWEIKPTIAGDDYGDCCFCGRSHSGKCKVM